MKFNELISKDMSGEIEVYLKNNDLLNTQTKLFDANFYVDEIEQWEEYKNNLKKYWNYDVCWFRPLYYTRESGLIVAYNKIVIEEPQKEELPF